MADTGSCYCRAITYEINLDRAEDARTLLCHCKNCKKFTGSPLGIMSSDQEGGVKITNGEEFVKGTDRICVSPTIPLVVLGPP